MHSGERPIGVHVDTRGHDRIGQVDQTGVLTQPNDLLVLGVLERKVGFPPVEHGIPRPGRSKGDTAAVVAATDDSRLTQVGLAVHPHLGRYLTGVVQTVGLTISQSLTSYPLQGLVVGKGPGREVRHRYLARLWTTMATGPRLYRGATP